MKEITEKQRKTRDKYAKKNNNDKKILMVTIMLLLISSLVVFGDNIAKATNSTDDILAMIEPMQNILKAEKASVHNINGTTVFINRVAEYSVAGRVVEEYDYTSNLATIKKIISRNEYYDKIAVKDVAIAYGPMALTENHKKMTYIMSGSRKISYAINDSSLVSSLGGLDVVKKYITNNHLIAANDEVEALIKRIDKDEYVQITGYLVNVSWEEGIYRYALESSLSREDVGNGACEVILVEDVKWIK